MCTHAIVTLLNTSDKELWNEFLPVVIEHAEKSPERFELFEILLSIAAYYDEGAAKYCHGNLYGHLLNSVPYKKQYCVGNPADIVRLCFNIGERSQDQRGRENEYFAECEYSAKEPHPVVEYYINQYFGYQ